MIISVTEIAEDEGIISDTSGNAQAIKPTDSNHRWILGKRETYITTER